MLCLELLILKPIVQRGQQARLSCSLLPLPTCPTLVLVHILELLCPTVFPTHSHKPGPHGGLNLLCKQCQHQHSTTKSLNRSASCTAHLANVILHRNCLSSFVIQPCLAMGLAFSCKCKVVATKVNSPIAGVHC